MARCSGQDPNRFDRLIPAGPYFVAKTSDSVPTEKKNTKKVGYTRKKMLNFKTGFFITQNQ